MVKYLFLFLLIGFFSCSKNQTDEASMFGATWKINYFFEVTDRTASYDVFYFMFNEDGTLMAHEGNRLTVGRWSEANGRMNILFESKPLLLQLKRDWLIVEKMGSLIKLKDDLSDSNAELHFAKQ